MKKQLSTLHSPLSTSIHAGCENLGAWMTQIQMEGPNIVCTRSVASINMNTGAPCSIPVRLITLKFTVINALPDVEVETDFGFASVAVYAPTGVLDATTAPGEDLTLTLYKQ